MQRNQSFLKKIKTSTQKRSLFKPGEIEGNSVFFFFLFHINENVNQKSINNIYMESVNKKKVKAENISQFYLCYKLFIVRYLISMKIK